MTINDEWNPRLALFCSARATGRARANAVGGRPKLIRSGQ